MSIETIKADILNILGANGVNWCKGSCAVDSEGITCAIRSINAKKWDVFGALVLANGDNKNFGDYHAVYNYLRSNIPVTYKNSDIESYNDDTDFNGILSLITGV